jgi:hypothetical protein
MMRKRNSDTGPRGERTTRAVDVHEWVRSLPWVVERAPLRALHGAPVRVFAVDCEPLGRRQVWLVTGLVGSRFGAPDVAVVMPTSIALGAHERGWVTHSDALLPEAHVLVTLGHDARSEPSHVEALLLAGYGYALA